MPATVAEALERVLFIFKVGIAERAIWGARLVLEVVEALAFVVQEIITLIHDSLAWQERAEDGVYCGLLFLFCLNIRAVIQA